ncbi:MAG: 4Fe-4S binding protein [Bacteroidales bacterium]|nr:4Fe-4S binding protein [Bacteroidales bacterium]
MEKPFEIVMLSGKGGTGKTSITASLAALAENAVFADCDVDAADLHLLLSPVIYQHEKFTSGAKAEINSEKCTACRLCKELCRFNAIEVKDNIYQIDEYACEGCGLCVEACPVKAISINRYENNQLFFSNCRFGPMIYGKLGIAEENSGRLVSKIRQYAKETALKNKARYILIDGPPGIGCPVISSVTGTDLVVAITEPTLSGWHDLQRLIEMIGRFRTPVQVIINKYDLNEDMTSTIETRLKSEGIPILGKIPYDDAMVYALLDSKTMIEAEPQGTITNELKKIWNTITSIIYEPKSI